MEYIKNEGNPLAIVDLIRMRKNLSLSLSLSHLLTKQNTAFAWKYLAFSVMLRDDKQES